MSVSGQLCSIQNIALFYRKYSFVLLKKSIQFTVNFLFKLLSFNSGQGQLIIIHLLKIWHVIMLTSVIIVFFKCGETYLLWIEPGVCSCFIVPNSHVLDTWTGTSWHRSRHSCYSVYRSWGHTEQNCVENKFLNEASLVCCQRILKYKHICSNFSLPKIHLVFVSSYFVLLFCNISCN